jgi:hypothetical protein
MISSRNIVVAGRPVVAVQRKPSQLGIVVSRCLRFEVAVDMLHHLDLPNSLSRPRSFEAASRLLSSSHRPQSSTSLSDRTLDCLGHTKCSTDSGGNAAQKQGDKQPHGVRSHHP